MSVGVKTLILSFPRTVPTCEHSVAVSLAKRFDNVAQYRRPKLAQKQTAKRIRVHLVVHLILGVALARLWINHDNVLVVTLTRLLAFQLRVRFDAQVHAVLVQGRVAFWRRWFWREKSHQLQCSERQLSVVQIRIESVTNHKIR